MGWLDTLLNWLLALLEWVCWPCHLIEWLGGLEQGAAVTLIVGLLNAAAILAAAILAIRAAKSVIKERSEERQFETAEKILQAAYKTQDATEKLINVMKFFHLANKSPNKNKALRDSMPAIMEVFDDLEEKASELQGCMAEAKIHHHCSIEKSITKINSEIWKIRMAIKHIDSFLKRIDEFPDDTNPIGDEIKEGYIFLVDNNEELLNRLKYQVNFISNYCKKLFGHPNSNCPSA